MTEFNVGETVFFTKDFIENRAAKHRHINDICREVCKSPDAPFIITQLSHIKSICWLACPSNPDWGVSLQGRPVKTWALYMSDLERRDSNTISLYDLNKGL